MKQLATLFVILSIGCSESFASDGLQKPTASETARDKSVDLPALMLKHKPPYSRADVPADPAITFERVDVLIERGFPGPAQTPYLSIGRNGSYLYRTETLDLPAGQSRPGTSQVARLPSQRLTELQRLLEATKWLTAPGGEGAARHTDADHMTLAVTRGGKTTTILCEGNRPAPYTALQKFFNDLARQEHFYYRLTRLPDESRETTQELHHEIECALGRSGRPPHQHNFHFERYHDLFAGTLDRWYAKDSAALATAVDLMLLLKRDVHGAAIARLCYDRDSDLRTTVARALPTLMGREAIPLLAGMIESTAEARIRLIGLGEPAVPTIVSIIEPNATRENQRSVGMIRAYIDHWSKLPKPIDPRVLKAVIANMQLENVRDRGLSYHRELLKLAGETEPKDLTALEMSQTFLKHLQSGDEAELPKIKDNVGSVQEWLKLRESFSPTSELALEKLFIDKTEALVLSRPIQDKAGNEIRLIVFMNLVRGTDWRVGPALAQPAQRTLYKDRFLQAHPDAIETSP